MSKFSWEPCDLKPVPSGATLKIILEDAAESAFSAVNDWARRDPVPEGEPGAYLYVYPDGQYCINYPDYVEDAGTVRAPVKQYERAQDLADALWLDYVCSRTK